MPRFAGFYVPGQVNINIGTPVGFGAAEVLVPGLPLGVGFPFDISGRATDEFFNMDQNVDTVTLEAGVDGEVVYSVTYDQTSTVTINVMKSSFVNIALSAAHNAIRNPIEPLLFTFPVRAFDPNAVGRFGEAQNCIVQRNPPLAFGATEGENSFTLLAATSIISHGARVF